MGLYARVELATTDEDVARRFHDLTGGQWSYRKPYKPTWKPIYRVRVEGQRAEHVVDRIYEHLGSRRRGQIDEMMLSVSRAA